MRIQLRNFSFRFAEQVFNSRLSIKQEIETLLLRACEDLSVLGRPGFDKIRKDFLWKKIGGATSGISWDECLQ